MTTYYSTLSLQYLGNSTPPSTTLNITSGDIILLGIDTSSYSDGSDWLRFGTSGCTVTPTGGFDGQEATITPTAGATSYSATFRTYNDGIPGFYYGKISGTISAAVVTPTYSVSNASTNEGASATANVTTTNVANGTTLYWTVDATTADISTTSGSFTVSANAGSFAIPAIADSLTEGTEFYTISVRTGSTAGSVVATSTLTINDTSTTPVASPTYSVGNASTNEGASATANVTTTNVANGTTLYWTVDATTADVSITSGSFSINTNTGSFTIPAIADSLTEGSETYNIRVRTGSTAGSIVASSILTINDTSTTPAATYALTFYTSGFIQTSTFNEGDSFYVFINTTGVPNGTYYWSTSSGSDLVAPVNGSFLIDSNFGSLYLTIATDSLIEGTENLTIYIRSGSVSGTILGSSSITINDTSVVADTTPDAFTFTDQTNVALNTVITSNTIIVSGINAATAISISGGTYSTDGVNYTAATGSVTNGQSVTVRHTSSGSNSAATSTTLTIGGVSDVFTSTTVAVAVDTTPNAFTFTDQTNVALNTVITSNTITVSGINAATAISISGGTYSINGVAYTSASGTVTNGQTVTVQHTSSSANSTATNTTLTIGGVSDVFTSTTVAAAADTVPNAFIFADQNDVAVSSTIVSSEIEILGINTGAPISITGGEYSIGLDPTTYTPYTSASGTIYNTQTIKVRHTSSSANNTSTSTTLTVGGVSDVFTSTTIGAIGAGIYGLQIFDSLGNITLDTSDITIKDFGIFSVASVTANGTITGVPLTSNSIALVNNNNGDGNTAIAAPAVTLAPASNSIVVSGGAAGFDVSIRVMEF